MLALNLSSLAWGIFQVDIDEASTVTNGPPDPEVDLERAIEAKLRFLEWVERECRGVGWEEGVGEFSGVCFWDGRLDGG